MLLVLYIAIVNPTNDMSREEQTERGVPSINLLGATGIGIGAMVGGGILALAGVAFSVSGPSAILAFLLNGIIALVTALSFAEMASAHPQSGGTYTFAKKAMSIHVAFGVGWIVWFASLVAAVLYALGFGSFGAFIIRQLVADAQPWLSEGSWLETSLALLALLGYGYSLSRQSGSGGALANIGKMSVFVVLIAAGLYFMVNEPISNLKQDLQPFFSNGFSGLLTAMGYTFIALQGFDLIASASSEIKDAPKTIPKAMVSTVLIGLLVYIPLLFVVSTVGVSDGRTVADMGDHVCFGSRVLAPIDGKIVHVEDGLPTKKVSLAPNEKEFPAGNHVVIDAGDSNYIFLCHLDSGSVNVITGQLVRSGDFIGLVGNSGNTSWPHLHMHVQDRDFYYCIISYCDSFQFFAHKLFGDNILYS
jgi:hypothetical protein